MLGRFSAFLAVLVKLKLFGRVQFITFGDVVKCVANRTF